MKEKGPLSWRAMVKGGASLKTKNGVRGMQQSKAMADWLSAGGYPDAQASCSQWAWEFLRRNSSYQSDYDLYESLGFSARKSWPLTDDMVIPHIVICEPAAIAGETWGRWKRRSNGVGRHWWPVRYFQQTYNVDYVVSPLRQECHPFMFGEAYVHFFPYCETGQGLSGAQAGSPQEVVVRLRLDIPIDAQLKAIKDYVNQCPEYQPFETRRHIKKFPHYLRAYDGGLAGKTAAEIADQFGKECAETLTEKAIRDYWTAAEKLVSSDYWKVAAAATPAKK